MIKVPEENTIHWADKFCVGLWFVVVAGSVGIVWYSYLFSVERDVFVVLLPQAQFIICFALLIVKIRSGSRYRVVSFLSVRSQAVVVSIVVASLMAVYSAFTIRGELELPQLSVSVFEQLVYHLLLVAFVEEFIFRDFPLRFFNKRMLSVGIIMSVLFALFHVLHGIMLLPFFFTVGLLFFLLRAKGIGLLALVILHFSLNVFNIIIFPVAGFRYGETVFALVAPLAVLTVTAFVGALLTTHVIHRRGLRGRFIAPK